jgi:hypothetical protein
LTGYLGTGIVRVTGDIKKTGDGQRGGEVRPNIGLELMRMRVEELRHDAGPLRRALRRHRHAHRGSR